MIHRFAKHLLIGLTWLALTTLAGAENFKLKNGQSLEGTPIAPNPEGIVIKKADGSFEPRAPWAGFTQEALKEFAKNPQAAKFVEDLIEPDVEEKAKKAAPAIELKPFPRAERPANNSSLLGGLGSSSVGFLVLVIIYLGNLYAGYEVGRFRNYPPGLTIGVAAVAPVVGPIVFLSLPTRIKTALEEASEAEAAAEAAGENAPSFVVPGTEERVAAAEAAEKAAASPHPPATVFQRGQITFNRRFFETRLAGFFGIISQEGEKGMVLDIKHTRGRHVGKQFRHLRLRLEALLIVEALDAARVGEDFTFSDTGARFVRDEFFRR